MPVQQKSLINFTFLWIVLVDNLTNTRTRCLHINFMAISESSCCDILYFMLPIIRLCVSGIVIPSVDTAFTVLINKFPEKMHFVIQQNYNI